jgi:hypothetical protein
VLHRGLHTSAMLPLYAKTRHRGPFLMIEVYLLLPGVLVRRNRHALTRLGSHTSSNLLRDAAWSIPLVLWGHQLTRQ